VSVFPSDGPFKEAHHKIKKTLKKKCEHIPQLINTTKYVFGRINLILKKIDHL
jgi:hypothetical protein